MRSLTRRQFGKGAFGVILLFTDSALNQEAIASSVEIDTERNADSWLQDWKAQAKKDKDLQGPLDLRRFKDPTYILLNPIKWTQLGKANCCFSPVIVPKGFVTDFASIPRVFWSLFKPDGDYAYAAVIHDFLYWQQDRPKAEADSIFRKAMNDLNITDHQAAILYKAVDTFGDKAWKENAKLKKMGEKRVLKLLPENPNITWAEWKQKNVF